jgi:hypothetical protein
MSVEIPSDFALFVKWLVALPGFSQEFSIYIGRLGLCRESILLLICPCRSRDSGRLA